MIKSFSSNLFLVSILITIMSVPIASFNFVKTQPNVLGNSEANQQKLEQLIDDQKVIIDDLIKKNNILSEELNLVKQELEVYINK